MRKGTSDLSIKSDRRVPPPSRAATPQSTSSLYVMCCKNTHYFRKVKTFGKNFIKILFEISCKPKDKEPDEETYPCCCYDSDNPHSDFVAYGEFGMI